eukprot:scaffold22586_cov138-Cylindrotheca_fusiformis.AAC.7
MSDAAAFFANKKKKKKAFKFNANKIDAATVTQTVHVDAPALSKDNEESGGASSLPAADVTREVNDTSDQWDEEALAAASARKTAVATGSELLDMKALDLKGNEQDDIAEKLRIEETKAQLAAAKEGMEKEAQRIKEQRENKQQDTATTSSKPRFGAAAAGLAATGGKWVPPHMRSGQVMMPSRLGMGPTPQKLDTQDESLFPDLAAADAILEQKKEKPAYSVAKKTPVGGGATWASRPKLNLKPRTAEKPPEAAKEEAPAPVPAPVPAPAPAPAPVPAPAPAPAPKLAEAVAPKPSIKPKKKKKKDLSTFKPSS